MPRYDGTGYMCTHDKALAAYLDTACWSACADGDEFYANELSEQAQAEMADDLRLFLSENEADIGDHTVRAAECFALSRNGHGAGFFDDGTWSQAVRARLQAAARPYGEQGLYRDDSGNIQIY